MSDGKQMSDVVRHAETTPLAGDASSRSMEQTFAQIYESGVWTLAGGSEEQDVSRSGPGSNLSQTAALRSALPGLVADLGVRSFFDAPCGDFFWMSKVALGVDNYIGADIMPGMIRGNNEKYGRPGREFRVVDVIRDRIPPVDMIFCRDCLVHFSDADVRRALGNFKRSGATYLAATTFFDRAENAEDISTGGWRPLNLRAAPFGLPQPLRLIDEKCTEVYAYDENGVKVKDRASAKFERRFSDKSIGVWSISDL